MTRPMIQVFKPSLGERELNALRDVFASGWIGLGPKTAEFERKFAAFVGAKHAVAVNSATAALHLSCLVLGLGPGDEVLVPTITFVSTAHAPAYCGATPVFVDVDPQTLNIDLEDLERKITPRSRAVIPVHFGGHACPMDEIHNVVRRHCLAVIEDASHAAGSWYRSRRIGSLPETDLTCFSFQAVKNLPVGDGGMITTNRDDLVPALQPAALGGHRQEHLGADRGSPRSAAFGNAPIRRLWMVLRGGSAGLQISHERYLGRHRPRATGEPG